MWWKLFLSFSKIGLFTFGGGYAMIPLIEREIIDKRGWVQKDQFLALLTLAQSAPGPIALNTAVFVGYRAYGYKGASASILGVVIPSFVILLGVAMFFSEISHNEVVVAMFKGMRPAVVALILAPVFGLTKGMGFKRILLAIAAAGIVWKLDVSPIWFIILGAVAGIVWVYFWLKRKKS